jgi:hypothetical protein
VPVYGILCDGYIFEFFLFKGDTTLGNTGPFSFKRGSRPNSQALRPFQLPNPADLPTTRPFIDALRPICEVVFDLLMSSYVSSLKIYHSSRIMSANEHQPKKGLDQWEEAIHFAVRASKDFREAEKKRQTQLTDEANSLVDQAMGSLKQRYEIPTFSSIISNQGSSNNVVWMHSQFINHHCS